jgi:hypothetical protein
MSETPSPRISVMHIEKKSLFSKMAAPASKANFTHSRRVDLSKPNPVRVLTWVF